MMPPYPRRLPCCGRGLMSATEQADRLLRKLRALKWMMAVQLLLTLATFVALWVLSMRVAENFPR